MVIHYAICYNHLNQAILRNRDIQREVRKEVKDVPAEKDYRISGGNSHRT